ncbi:4-coumarate--CoA ligase-like 9 [Pistacia vera]|uniref:4-coumarate--CoA ligase-like 9 n=1 Tax=Pistacia vera TaxID=55513 RepID=UPI00126374F8|nr:4-coumarate--CoA ligase-like 9 [Pistacia vera]
MEGSGTNSNVFIHPATGFCSLTKTFHSLRPEVPLPPPSQPLSITQFTLSLLQSTATNVSQTPFLINSVTDQRLTYADFLLQVHSLSLSLRTHYSLSKGDVVFILASSSFQIPVLYFSLFSLGVIISPANPLSSHSEISHQVHVSKPSVAFATSHTSHKLPSNLPAILIDSPQFISLSTQNLQNQNVDLTDCTISVQQSDSAAILYSSGTTGKVKGVLLTHRNVIALIAILHHVGFKANPSKAREVSLLTIPLFHVFGFFEVMKAVSTGGTLVLTERFDFEAMLKCVEKYKITSVSISPPVVVMLLKSALPNKYDLSSLRSLICGGAPLGVEVAKKFNDKFPHMELLLGYGMTEGGGISAIRGRNEAKRYGSVGLLTELLEAKIVDPVTVEALSPGQKGELWLRGPTVMKGYVGDDKATSETLDSEGWLKTGDLCYFDSDGFLFIVDRLKEIIKYKAYQVTPAELEHLLQSNPEISDAAVIPYPDEEDGEIPVALVVRKPGSYITENQVMDFIAKQVAPYKKIRGVAFVNSIPKSPAGKILRRELITHALSANLSKL